jgi:hypothetical protein
MKPIDPVRGPYATPRSGKLAQNLIPKPYEVVVLRSRSGKMIQLRRGDPPTFGQRMVGGYTEVYFVDAGRQTRTFAAQLPTADPGVDLIGEVDVELTVDDCVEVVRERRGDLAELLANWCQERASIVTSRFSVGDHATSEGLAALSAQVTQALQTPVQRPELFGMSIRELRVRLRFANASVVQEQGAATLKNLLHVKSLARMREICDPVFGPEFSQIYVTLVERHPDQIPVFLERLQTSQLANQQNRWQLLNSLLSDPAIEPHFKAQFAQEVGKMLLTTDPSNHDLAASLFHRASEFELPEAGSSDAEDQ